MTACIMRPPARSCLWMLAAVTLAAVSAANAAAAERVGPIEVNVLPLPTVDNTSGNSYGVRHGYLEYRVQLRNLSDKSLRVDLDGGGLRGINYGVNVRRTVRIGASQEVAVSLFQPAGNMASGQLVVQVEGERDPKTIFVATPVDRGYDDNLRFTVLTSRGVPQEFRETKPPAAASASHPSPPEPPGPPMAASPGASVEPYVFLRSESPVGQWSSNWLSYSGYDAIVVTGGEVEEMPLPVQMALRRYIECGGFVIVHAAKAPNVFCEGGEADAAGYQVGFGRVAAGYQGKADWRATRRKLTSAPLHEYHPQQKPSDLRGLLVTETTVPIRGLFVLVLLFAVGIGPANLWVLSRLRRRIWLWWNVPLLSLLTCLVVFAYSLASEGITGRGRVASLTVLDERCHRATTIGYLSFYCPLTPSSGPQFGIDTDVTLLANQLDPYRHYRPYRDSDFRLIDWTRGQSLVTGWVNARVPTYFQIRESEERRERLTVDRQHDGSLKIVNALGADIVRLYLADAEGRIFESHDIAAGAERLLAKPLEGKKAGRRSRAEALRGLFTSGEWIGPLAALRESNSSSPLLAPGCYLAILKKSPFVETPLPGVDSEHTAAIVCGQSKGSDHGR